MAVLAFALPARAVEFEAPGGKMPAPTPVPAMSGSLTPVVLPEGLKPAEGVDLTNLPVAPEMTQVPGESRVQGEQKSSVDRTASAEKRGGAESPQTATAQNVTRMAEHVSKAAEKAGKAEASGEDRSGATRQIQAAIEGRDEKPGDYVLVYLEGVRDGTIPTGPQLEPKGKPGEYSVPVHDVGAPFVPERFVNPGEVYSEAYHAASYAAKRRGLSGRVFFAQVTGSLPLRGGEHAKFSFYPAGPQNQRSVIYVDFSRGPTTPRGRYDVKTAVHTGAPAPQARFFPELDAAAGYPYVAKGFVLSPESALSQARREIPSFGASASFSAQLEKEDAGTDVWYHLYDDDGNHAAVNARTGEARVMASPLAGERSAPPASTAKLALIAGALFIGVGVLFLVAGGTNAGWISALFFVAGALLAGPTLLERALSRAQPPRVDGSK